LGLERIKAGFSISPATSKMIYDFHSVIHKSVSGAVHAVAQNNEAAAKSVVKMKNHINELATQAAIHHAERLIADEPNRVKAYTIEVDIVEKQKRIYYFAKRMAKTVLTGDNLSTEEESITEDAQPSEV
ncbi:MAG: hypothetical protein HQL46_14800, partial [Gammaproteobacteria bacterium]|nr:hypothetical protein [Gammaproteobacteria bacterium]